MLRRIADHLFWAARYLERAQWRARLVDVNYNLLLEVPPRATDPWEPILVITGELETFGTRYSHADERAVVTFFALEKTNPASIRSCLEVARTNLHSLRHQIPSELWLEVNRLYLESLNWPKDALALPSIPGFFATLRESFYMITGVIQATMARDTAYDFVEAGTMVECADNVARLLDVKYHYVLPRVEDVGGAVDVRQWMALLRSASSLEAFRQIYGNAFRADRVVEILMFAPMVPRSARFCVDRLGAAIRRIASREGESAPQLSPERPVDLLAKTTAAEVVASGLHQFLLNFQHECAALATRVTAAYMAID